MQTQGDMTVRMVTLANLRAMCARVNGICHAFSVDVGATRASVTYSNPDEYGNARPYTARFPLAPNAFDTSNPWIIFTLASDHGAEDEYGRDSCYQIIDAEIICAPVLWRDPVTGAWREESEIRAERGPSIEKSAMLAG